MLTENQTEVLENIRKEFEKTNQEFKPGFSGVQEIIREKKEWAKRVEQNEILKDKFKKILEERVKTDLEKLNKEFEGILEWYYNGQFTSNLAPVGFDAKFISYEIITSQVTHNVFKEDLYIPTKIKVRFHPRFGNSIKADTIEQLFEESSELKSVIAQIIQI